MTGTVVNFERWKAAHPPALVVWQHALAAAVEWHRLWLLVVYGSLRK
jgi:hypothetical protein